MLLLSLAVTLCPQNPIPPTTPVDGLMNGGFEQVTTVASDPTKQFLGAYWLGAETSTSTTTGKIRELANGNHFLFLKKGEGVHQRVGVAPSQADSATLSFDTHLGSGAATGSTAAYVRVAERRHPQSGFRWGIHGYRPDDYVPTIPGVSGSSSLWTYAIVDDTTGATYPLSEKPETGNWGRTDTNTEISNGKGGVCIVQFEDGTSSVPRSPLVSTWTAPMDGNIRILFRAMSINTNNYDDVTTEVFHNGVLISSQTTDGATDTRGDGEIARVDVAVASGDTIDIKHSEVLTAAPNPPRFRFASHIEYRQRELVYVVHGSGYAVPPSTAETHYISIAATNGWQTHSSLPAGQDFVTAFTSPPNPPLEVELVTPRDSAKAARFDDLECLVQWQSDTAEGLWDRLISEADGHKEDVHAGTLEPSQHNYWVYSRTADNTRSLNGSGAMPGFLEQHTLPNRWDEDDFELLHGLYQMELEQGQTPAGFWYAKWLTANGGSYDTPPTTGAFYAQSALQTLMNRYDLTGDVQCLDRASDLAQAIAENGAWPAGTMNGIVDLGDMLSGKLDAGTGLLISDANSIKEFSLHKFLHATAPVFRWLVAARAVNDSLPAPRYPLSAPSKELTMKNMWAAAQKSLEAVRDQKFGTGNWIGKWGGFHGQFQDTYAHWALNCIAIQDNLDRFEPMFDSANDTAYGFDTATVRDVAVRDLICSGADYYVPILGECIARGGYNAADQMRAFSGVERAYEMRATTFGMGFGNLDQIPAVFADTALYAMKFMHTAGVWTNAANSWFQNITYSDAGKSGNGFYPGPLSTYNKAQGHALAVHGTGIDPALEYALVAAWRTMSDETQQHFAAPFGFYPTVQETETMTGDRTGLFVWRFAASNMEALHGAEVTLGPRPTAEVLAQDFGASSQTIQFEITHPALSTHGDLVTAWQDRTKVYLLTKSGSSWSAQDVLTSGPSFNAPTTDPANGKLTATYNRLTPTGPYKFVVCTYDRLNRPHFDTVYVP